MIKSMCCYTSIKTGRTTYRVFYDNGKHERVRTFLPWENWPMTVVKFYTAEDTKVVDDRIVENTRYQRLEKR